MARWKIKMLKQMDQLHIESPIYYIKKRTERKQINKTAKQEVKTKKKEMKLITPKRLYDVS